jgi:hypothetical protein
MLGMTILWQYDDDDQSISMVSASQDERSPEHCNELAWNTQQRVPNKWLA